MLQATPDDLVSASRSFRVALGRFATGVTVVTTTDARGNDVGVTANSFNSVSLDPPMVLWSLARTSRSVDAFMRSDYFAVHVLSSSQHEVSARFARSGVNKFEDFDVERGLGGIPLLHDCSARFQCRRAFIHEGGDHLIIIGKVEAFDHTDRPPLVFHGGTYAFAIEKKPQPSVDQLLKEEPDSSFSQDFLIYLLGLAHFRLLETLRRDLDRHRLSEEEWFALSILGVSGHRAVAEIAHLLEHTGKRVTYELFARLAALGFVDLNGGGDQDANVVLTESGRRTVVELVALAKAAESQAEQSLGKAETLLLKSALRKIIEDSERPVSLR
jgi:3-hydroxy-9,10-secoandrosta-1,3,5(10)-triene-9,17-dione monooxygenase reductase component